MDLTESIAPKSDQLNAEDLLSGPRTVQIESVTKGSAEQPVNIHLVEFPGRPFRPSKTVRRILVSAWGPDASTYVGRRMSLYRDASVRFGGQEVGGIRVSHLSHIDKRLTLALTVTRGRRTPHVVEPLPDAPRSDVTVDVDSFIAAIDAATTKDVLTDLWHQSSSLPEDDKKRTRARITARVSDLEAPEPELGLEPAGTPDPELPTETEDAP
ncbi:hypothetical protein [Prescottella equi]|uniref:hypothetical protein n=1 Tax=Rhodococcus hoagii TaxID=43767 RepID=UPI0019818212|nr:hypothetical protein [Prescottella equi]NKU37726.1 hypothetical protein [Prescottella equi]NKU94061.1 hypothetical protein [Prescottella equi]